MKKLFILLFIGIVGCTSEYEKGESLFKQEKYSEARSHFELVEKGDKNYDTAQLKIEQIDKIIEKELFDIVSKASKELFDSAFKAFSYYDFDGAKELFYQIEKTSEFYEKSQYYLSKIDSIEKVMTLHDERINKARNIEEARIEKMREANASKKKETYPVKDKNAQLKGLDKIRDWKNASYEPRLAICIQFAIIANKEPGQKVTAVEIHNCIEEATRGLDVTNDLTISVVAGACVSEIRKL